MYEIEVRIKYKDNKSVRWEDIEPKIMIILENENIGSKLEALIQYDHTIWEIRYNYINSCQGHYIQGLVWPFL